MNPVNGWVLGALNPGDYIDIAVDFSMGYVWLGKNGTWNAGAQPFSGLPYTAPASISKPTASFTPGTTLYLAASAYLSTDTTTLDVNYAQLASVAPSGFIPWIGPPNPPALTGSQGFALELNQDNTSFTIWPQPGGHRVGFTQLAQPNGYPVDNIITDPWTGIAMIVQNSQVWYYDFTDPAPVMQPYSYTSKVYQQNTKKSYSAMRVFLTVPPNTPPQAPQTNELPETDPSWNTLGAGQWAIVKVYADVSDTNYDGTLQLVCAREVRKSGELLRIPGGFKAERWQVEVMGRVVVSNVQLATSVKELGNV